MFVGLEIFFELGLGTGRGRVGLGLDFSIFITGNFGVVEDFEGDSERTIVGIDGTGKEILDGGDCFLELEILLLVGVVFTSEELIWDDDFLSEQKLIDVEVEKVF